MYVHGDDFVRAVPRKAVSKLHEVMIGAYEVKVREILGAAADLDT